VIEERETLRGLKGVFVLIEYLKEDVAKAGLTDTILQTGVELKLRKAGIRVLTEDEWFLTQGRPYLYVRVRTILIKGIQIWGTHQHSGFIYGVTVQFNQDVILSRNRSISSSAGTWGNSWIGTVIHLRNVRVVISDLVDKFMNDYLAVNPK